MYAPLSRTTMRRRPKQSSSHVRAPKNSSHVSSNDADDAQPFFSTFIERFGGNGTGGGQTPALAAADVAHPFAAATATQHMNTQRNDGQARPFNPSDEYQQLLDAVSAKGAFGGTEGDRPKGPDPYNYLVGREKRVLDAIDRMTAERMAQTDREQSIFGASLATHANRAIQSLRGCLDDATAIRSPRDAIRVLHRSIVVDDARRLYLGTFLVLLALIAVAVQSM